MVQCDETHDGFEGEYNMNVCVVVSESMFSPHNHVLTVGLPVFCSAGPTLLPVKLWSTW